MLLIPNFLSADEVVALTDLGRTRRQALSCANAVSKETVATAVERRVTRLTGLAPHASEDRAFEEKWPMDIYTTPLQLAAVGTPRLALRGVVARAREERGNPS